MDRRNVWTYEADGALRTLWSEGHSAAEIGRRMGTTKNSIIGRAHRLNLPARSSPIVGNATGPAPFWTPDVVAELTALRKQGYGPTEIARKIGSTEDVVSNKIYQMRLAAGKHTLPPLLSLSAPPGDDAPVIFAPPVTRAAPSKPATAAAQKTRKTKKLVIISQEVRDDERRIKTFHAGDNEFASSYRRLDIRHSLLTAKRPKPTFNVPSDVDVAEFIARRGVTVCPAAAVGITTATIAPDDRAVIAAHDQQQIDAWLTKNAPRMKRAGAAGARSAALNR